MNLKDLEKTVAAGESETLELKETTGQRKEACRTLCAFLNGNGGLVVFGVSRKGVLSGQIVSDETKRDLFELFGKFEPAASIATEWIAVSPDRVAIVCRVGAGAAKPYLWDGRAYKRVQSSTTAMRQEEYERMLSDRGGFRSPWELRPGEGLEIGDLDLDEVGKTARMAIEVGRLDSTTDTADTAAFLRKLKLAKSGEILNGAAVLFGGDDLVGYPQCQLKMARFRGTGKNEFSDEKRISGNIFKLIDAGMRFCFDHLPLSAKVEGLERTEKLEIPPEALREAILNALVHRDYSRSAAVSLAIYDDRLVITSPGGLPPGKTASQLMEEHESEPRNFQIAHVLYLRKTVEAWGRGIERMVAACRSAGLADPVIEEKGGFVHLTFSRPMAELGEKTEKLAEKRGKIGEKPEKLGGKRRKPGEKLAEKTGKLAEKSVESSEKPAKVAKKATGKAGKVIMNAADANQAGAILDQALPSLRRDARANTEKVLAGIIGNPSATLAGLALSLSMPDRTIRNAISILKEVGILYRVGGDRGGHWLVSDR